VIELAVQAGQPLEEGPLTLELRERYWASRQGPRYSTPVRYDEPG